MYNILIRHIKFFLIFLLLIYFYLFFEAKTIETNITFPWIWKQVNYSSWSDLNYEEINIKDNNWNNINWIFLKWKKEISVYYFHWNWLPLSYFLNEIKYINSLWYTVFAYDYPWYWKSEWKPYEENISKFSDIFYNYIKKEKNILENKLVLWGISVWTAVATDFAKDNSFDKLILISPFYSRYDMSKSMLGVTLQKYLFLKNSFTTWEYLKNISNPLLIIHWTNDKVVPFEHWKKVFNSSVSHDKYFIDIPNFWHNWIIYTYGDNLKDKFIEFIEN